MNDKLKSLRDSAEYAEERLVASVQSLLEEILHEKGLSKSDLAKRMGVSKARVSQIFSDNQNFTLRLLANAFHALGVEISIDRARQQTHCGVGEPLPQAVSFKDRTREISHGFEWLDRNLEMGGRVLEADVLPKALMAELLTEALRTMASTRGKGSPLHTREDSGTALDWSRDHDGSNVIPMVKRASGNG